MPVQDLRSIARELYAGAPDRFVSERDSRARALRAAGDRPLADRVRALPKPSIAAWAVGLLARESPDFETVLQLGRTLRRAQDDLDPDALRLLGPERRRLVSAMAREATALARRHDRTLGPSAVLEVEQTIQAALADPDAAAAVLSGRLVRSLSAEGPRGADLEGALGGEGAVGTEVPAGPAASKGTAVSAGPAAARAEKKLRDGERIERLRLERERMEAVLLDAVTAAASAAERRTRIARRRSEEEQEGVRLDVDLVSLRARLARLEEESEASAARLRSIDDQLEAARSDEDRASRDVDEIRLRIRRLP